MMPHVLIVEDHEENRNLLKMLLEANGYRVTAAGDGLEALTAARRDLPDAVVSDVLMPKMDGFALCRAWMQDTALSPIPFIFYSATYVRTEDEQFAMAQGAVRYLIKPMQADEFLRELRAVLQQWAGRVAPSPDPPLDDATSHALHESALGRKVEDKMIQLEAANRKLRETEARFRSLFDSMLNGFAYCRMEYDDHHRPVDFVYVDVNRAFDRLTGLKDVVGRRVSEVIPGIREASPELFETYDRVASTGIAETFEFDFKSMAKWLNISVYSPQTGYFVAIFDDITEQKRTEQALRESETRHRAIFEAAVDGILVADLETKQFLTANEAICRMLGYTREEMVRLGVSDIHPREELPRVEAHFERMRHGDPLLAADMSMVRKDGSIFYADIKAAPIRMDGKACALGIIRDSTERRAAEAKVRRLTQLYAALSQCNEIIVRCTSEKELFENVCRAAVQFGGMRMAWVGIVDSATLMVQPAAGSGDRAEEYLRDIEISVNADSRFGQGTIGTAIREDHPVWCQDFQNDPLASPWRHARRAHFGWAASAAIPLHRKGVPIGVLNLYADEIGAFDEAARKLLVEMATDIDFALDNFTREAARASAEKNLRAAEEQFRRLVEQPITGIYIIQDDKLAYVNPRYAEILRYDSADELIGRDVLTTVDEKDRAMVLEKLRLRSKGGNATVTFEFAALRKDGVTVEVGVHGARATHQGRPAIIGLIQDISEKKRAEERIQRYIWELKTAFMSTVEVATSLSEMRDPYTAGHERRVGKLAAAIGACLGLDEQRIEGLRVAGYLHDIGKITIPAEILSKPGRLNELQYELIKGHPQSGYDVLRNVKFPWPIAEVALQHHERVDGSGYPRGLKGEAILYEARVMAVADVVEAMSSHRPYRPGLGIDKALAEIERGRGTAYDADVVDACLRLFRADGYQLPD
jgi:PAS domain S-box-containing protein